MYPIDIPTPEAKTCTGVCVHLRTVSIRRLVGTASLLLNMVYSFSERPDRNFHDEADLFVVCVIL